MLLVALFYRISCCYRVTNISRDTSLLATGAKEMAFGCHNVSLMLVKDAKVVFLTPIVVDVDKI